MMAHVIRQLFKNDLPLLRLILPARRLPVKHRFSVSEQSCQLILQLDDMAVGFAQTHPFAGDSFVQPALLLLKLRRRRIHREADRTVPRVKICHIHTQDGRQN